MNDRAIVAANGADIIERVVIAGDLSKLAPGERVDYYRRTCESLGLNPLTKPFDYINLNGKLTLYARRDCTDQLRKIHRISVTIAGRDLSGDVYIVTARATTPDDRTDESIGAVNIKGLSGEALANAYMKAETKAKRRVTLSIVGLGWLDETEVSTVPDARPVAVTDGGEILPALPSRTPQMAPLQPEPDAAPEWLPPAPESQSARAYTAHKGATVRTNRWQQAAADLAVMVDYYQDKAGKPDYHHMTGAALKVGYPEINEANLDEVIAAIADYATANQQSGGTGK